MRNCFTQYMEIYEVHTRQSLVRIFFFTCLLKSGCKITLFVDDLQSKQDHNF